VVKKRKKRVNEATIMRTKFMRLLQNSIIFTLLAALSPFGTVTLNPLADHTHEEVFQLPVPATSASVKDIVASYEAIKQDKWNVDNSIIIERLAQLLDGLMDTNIELFEKNRLFETISAETTRLIIIEQANADISDHEPYFTPLGETLRKIARLKEILDEKTWQALTFPEKCFVVAKRHKNKILAGIAVVGLIGGFGAYRFSLNKISQIQVVPAERDVPARPTYGAPRGPIGIRPYHRAGRRSYRSYR